VIVLTIFSFANSQEDASEYNTYIEEEEEENNVEDTLIFRRIARAVSRTVSRAASSVGRTVTRATNSVGSTVSRAASSVGSTVSRAASAVIDKGSDIIESAVDLGKDVWNRIKSESREEETNFCEKMTEVPNTVEQRENEAFALLISEVTYRDNARSFDFTKMDLGVPAIKKWRFITESRKKELVSLLYANDLDKRILIAFRGTKKTNIKDWIVNAKVTQRNNPWGSGSVHKGMLEEINLLLEDSNFISALNLYLTRGYSVVITGHSQGGGESSIFASSLLTRINQIRVLKPKISIILFSPPRPGNKEFSSWLMTNVKNIVRFELSEDPVPLLPLILLNYYHVGKLVYHSCGGFGPRCHSLGNHYDKNNNGRLRGYLPSKDKICNNAHRGIFKSLC